MKLPVLKKQPARSQLTVWDDPIDQMLSLVRQSFEPGSFFSPWLLEHWLPSKTESGYWWPRADMVETDKEIKIRIDLPGVKPEKIDLEADNQSLVISGKMEREEEIKQGEWYCLERQRGEFKREFELPGGCEIDKIEAVSRHGTLYVTVPKKPEAQKKKIAIKNEA